MSKVKKEKSAPKGQDRRPIPECVLGIEDRIRKTLKKKGWSQADLARRLDDMNRGQLSGMIRSPNITAASVVRLAERLEVDPGWLLTGNEDEMRPRRIILTEGTAEYDRAIEAIARR